jgi:hypothetical protein
MGGGYPVQLTLTDEREINRLWGIPFVGVFVRMILAIPHMIVLGIMSIGLYIWLLLGWIPILLLGRQPSLVVKFLTEYLHRAFRVAGYAIMLLPGGYPPLEPGAPTPVDLKIDVEGRSLSRLWGIPFVGLFVRYIVLIPHLIVLMILGIVVYISFIVLWIPILLMGKYPNAFASFYTGVFRYGARVAAYLFLLPVPYPPFSFS